MPNDPDSQLQGGLDQWSADLVCPVCFSPLHFTASAVTCTSCARVYPVVDGIPVLIPERASNQA